MNTKTILRNERLARIRAQAHQWEAINPEAKNWDTPFLLKIIDRQQRKIKRLESK